jgi:phytoene/squalene synthetase
MPTLPKSSIIAAARPTPSAACCARRIGAATDQNLRQSDDICTSLQLINFWQDVEIDSRKNRIYLPQDEMQRYGVNEQQIAAGDVSGQWERSCDSGGARAR